MRQKTGAPEIIAHRGAHDRYPENSLPAFEAAVDQGADGIELDVHATRDGVVVVHHDPILSRISASPLAGHAISAIESSELGAFEISPGVGIPTLEDVLQAVGPRASLYVEIKASHIESLVAAELTAASAALSPADRSASVAVHSFDHRIVARFASLMPDLPTGILLVGYPVDSPALLRAARARDLWQSSEFIDEELVASVHAAGGRVIAWTCNDHQEWKRLSSLAVDGICTDRTAAAVEWRAAAVQL
jgi:glycerophosphoryl diester phosphodiesterase